MKADMISIRFSTKHYNTALSWRTFLSFSHRTRHDDLAFALWNVYIAFTRVTSLHHVTQNEAFSKWLRIVQQNRS